MAADAIALLPAGTFGLDPGGVSLWRFDERLDAERPFDERGNVDALGLSDNLTNPLVVDAAAGRGRRFLASASRGYRAQDLVSGTTLLQRDASVQALVWWDLAAQHVAGTPGTLYARGKSDSTAERISAGIDLAVINAPARIGSIRWRWQDAAGTHYVQSAGQFEVHPTDVQLLTATRRWVSSSEVVLRYYLGATLLAEYTSANGSIGGGTTGTTQIGARWTGASYGVFLDGVIDELRVVDRELTAEEVEATWRRITVHQPRGYQLFRELHDPGFPISEDPGSRVQRETRWLGHALGNAAAIGHDIADNALPDRAYGRPLEEWESIYNPIPTPRQGDATEQRRARVLARMRQRRGFSIPGVKDALAELVDADTDDLEFVGFSQTTRDEWATKNPLRWGFTPEAQWATVTGELTATVTAADIPFDGTSRAWYTARQAIGGRGRGAAIAATIDLATWAANGETGLWFGDMAVGDLVLVGLRHTGVGAAEIRTEFYKSWVSAGSVVRVAGFAWDKRWLLLRQEVVEGEGFSMSAAPKFTIGYAVAEAGPYTTITGIQSPASWSLPHGVQWAGHYVRTVGGAATLSIKIPTTVVRAPYGTRANRAYVYRDPLLGGAPDIEAANHVLRGLKHAHTTCRLITDKVAKCDDPDTLCDATPMGAI